MNDKIVLEGTAKRLGTLGSLTSMISKSQPIGSVPDSAHDQSLLGLFLLDNYAPADQAHHGHT